MNDDKPVGARPRGAGLRSVWSSAVAVLAALGPARVRWAAPVVLVLLVVAAIVAVLAMVPAIAPFVYPLL